MPVSFRPRFFKSLLLVLFGAVMLQGSVSMGYALVPKCSEFNLNELIKKTRDLSPDYQCEINSKMSRSSQPDSGWIQSLSNPSIREIPFRSVVNLRGESNAERDTVLGSGMIAKHIPVRDLHAPEVNQVIDFLRFVTNPVNQPVLVHCKAGQGRTGTFVGSYRIAVENASLEDVVREARSFNVGEEQIEFLKEFFHKFHRGEVQL